MCIIKCWNSSLSLPQMVLSHSLGTRYVRLCWVDDRATQKALVGDPTQVLQDNQCDQCLDLMFTIHGRAPTTGRA
ncbi:NBS-LRR type resistance protein [Cucumis melo var. makuwa]|uniref:NBS-LRR type resistance protein n=1 Tax=Cucumis melo var. makuwa TaxID=1194695 RepID=A0A5A7UCQ6_CUCMM|nr:NBS-LRR type resistance protein [Cucumis melo var. makuwa]TYK19147.1 NBS-LRR type resistance protein [Cucumis melo var. makuwa]